MLALNLCPQAKMDKCELIKVLNLFFRKLAFRSHFHKELEKSSPTDDSFFKSKNEFRALKK